MAVLAALLVVVASVLSPAEVAEVLDARGAYAQPGAEISQDEAERVAVDGYGLVVLADPLPDPAEVFAGDILDGLGRLGSRVHTVLVVTPDDLGAQSSRHDTAQLSRALDAFRGRADEGYRAFVDALSGTGAGVDAGRGRGGLGTLLVVAGVVGLAVVGLAVWSSRRSAAVRRRREAELRAEITRELSEVADAIVVLDDRVTVAGDPDLRERFGRAAAAYQEIRDELARAGDPATLARLDDRLDDVLWELGAVEARLDGRPEPLRPPVPASPAETLPDHLRRSPDHGRATGGRRPAPPGPGGVVGGTGGLDAVLGGILGATLGRRMQRRSWGAPRGRRRVAWGGGGRGRPRSVRGVAGRARRTSTGRAGRRR